MKRLVWIGILWLAFASMGMVVKDSKPVGCGGVGKVCKYNNTNYYEGETFKATDGCNTCSCSDGQVICTLKACVPNGCVGLKPAVPKVCNAIYAPVCGCDGKTYPNACDADNNGITSHKKGKCPEPPKGCKGTPSKNVSCPENYAPVCGCDGKTYSNTCFAKAAGVTSYTTGKCAANTCKYNGKEYKAGDRFKDKDGCNTCTCGKDGSVACTEMACPTPQECGGKQGKTCGKDEWCFYEIGKMCGQTDLLGVCQRIMLRKCTTDYKPVCGCDNKTYTNECQALNARVSVLHVGACSGTSVVCKANGRTYKPGETFKIDCNTCTCGKNGSIGCTKIKCPSRTCGGIAGKKCNTGEYCHYEIGDQCGAADQLGTCRPRPQRCATIHKSVCGCDGKTYSNACFAAAKGVSVAKNAACNAPGVCKYNGKVYKAGESFKSTDGCNTCFCSKDGRVACTKKACVKICGGIRGAACAKDEYCFYTPQAICGYADATGVCKKRPQNCPSVYKPVCGCDGKTYSNSCMAAGNGQGVYKEGECKSTVTCKYNGKVYKAGENFKSFDGCNTCSCDKYGRVICTKRACVKACGGRAGNTCSKDEYCAFSLKAMCGRADAQGVCKKRPGGCTTQYAPVCGCDNKTYSNSCVAASKGVGVLHEKACP